ncbi:MAG TPA: PIN domain-containing protein [Nitrospiraceae bacterium]|nr:PIN domain-containing protein [Nitrospiraceae bacterium]
MLSLSFDARIMSEYADVLARPRFQFDEDQTQMLLEYIRTEGQVVTSEPLPAKLPDTADEPFLEVALAGRVQCLITGNMKHFPAPGRQGMTVLSPSEFLDFYRQERRLRKS